MSKQGHPAGLYVLFFTEMGERFSYYGMRAIFILFMTKALLFDKAFASEVYGSYTGLVYLTPLLGGYIADRYWGNRKSIFWGGVMMALGQFFMFLSASFYTEVGFAATLMWVGLFALIFGNGFFKPNISTMVGQLYPKGDHRIDGAFTIFYMGINIGAFFAPLVAGALGDTGSPADFKWGFLAAAIAMVISTAMFEYYKNMYVIDDAGEAIGGIPTKEHQKDVDKDMKKTSVNPVQIAVMAVVFITTFLIFYLAIGWDEIGSLIFGLTITSPFIFFMDKSLTRHEKDRITAIYILAFFTIFFWAAFEQAGASLTFFADEQMDRVVDMPINILMTQILGLVVFIGVFAWMWISGLIKKFDPMTKGITYVFFGASITLFISLGFNYDNFIFHEIPASWYQAANAIFIVAFAPVFVALWNSLDKIGIEPGIPMKMAFGLILLSFGYLIIAFGVDGLEPGVKVSMMWLLSMYLMHTMGELALSPIGLSMISKLSPLKFASLLMGVWFMSISAANKFAGVLSGLYPEEGNPQSFIVFDIVNLNDFFMLFFFLAFGSGIVLFFINKLVQKLMHEDKLGTEH
jgi:proton-dependent oligopeptide transporter, POT family